MLPPSTPTFTANVLALPLLDQAGQPLLDAEIQSHAGVAVLKPWRSMAAAARFCGGMELVEAAHEKRTKTRCA